MRNIVCVHGVAAYLMLTALSLGSAQAADWKHSIEVGALITSGNSKTQTINAKGHAEMTSGDWKQLLDGSAVNSRQGSITSAEKYNAALKTEYALSDLDNLFVRLGFESDRFAGYRQRFSETVGYGRIFANTDTFDWKAELGVGFRQSKLLDRSRRTGAILRAQTDAAWKINEQTKLTESLSTEGGKNGWISRSETALLNQMNDNLASKVSLTLTHNSKVPAGRKNIDTELAFNLVYSFDGK